MVGLLAPRPTPKLEDHPSSAVRDCLFNLFATTILIGGRSPIRNLRTRPAVVTRTHYMGPQYRTCHCYKLTMNNFSQNLLVQIPTYTEIQQVDHNPPQLISRFARPNLSESKCYK